jgi:hypothetical protein
MEGQQHFFAVPSCMSVQKRTPSTEIIQLLLGLAFE